MKTSFTGLKTFVALVGLIACATFAQGQNRERFGISAKAGGINAVSGKVSVKREGKPVRLLTSQDDLESGDIVSTNVSGQVEVLLSPGSYLRLAERSEFVMEDTSLDNLLVRLTKGSAIIEATGPGDYPLYIPVVTEQHRMTIVRPGVYRINVAPGTTELFVRKGRMALSDNKDDVVKGGKKVSFTSDGQHLAKLTDSDTDQFDDWSKTRGQTLARANERLSARMVNGYLLANSWNFATSGFSSSGFWTWSPFSSCYTFLPFRYGWGSPYGGSYGAYANSWNGYQNHNPYNPVNTRNSSGGSGSGYPGGGGNSGSGSGGYSGGGSSGGYGGGSSGGRSTPSVSAPPTAGPRDPDSGGRGINAIKPPIN
jgi:FecR protein